MDQEEQALERLKAKMTVEQRKNMAEIIANELKRRESLKTGTDNAGVRLNTKKFVASSGISGGLDSDSMREVYTQTNETIRNLRLQKIDEQLHAVRNAKTNMSLGNGVTAADVAAARGRGKRGRGLPKVSLTQALMVLGVVALAGSKFLLSSGTVDASVLHKTDSSEMSPQPAASAADKAVVEAKVEGQKPAQVAQAAAPAEAPQSAAVVNRIAASSPTEAKVLTELDARRVELERRKGQLDKKEAELAGQSQVLNERMAELKGLVARLSDVRNEKDQQHDARMEQLANVYGAMDPKEAAPLISKLDLDIAIPLLERLPGKRMGQILAMMDKDRAIELTRRLTAK